MKDDIYAPPRVRAVNADDRAVRPFPPSLLASAMNDGSDRPALRTALDGLARDLDAHTMAQKTSEDPMAALDRLRPTLLQEVAAVLVSLPFGEMMELAAGIAASPANGSSDLPSSAEAMALATQIHAWAKRVNAQDRGGAKQPG